jgi:acylphosphatase
LRDSELLELTAIVRGNVQGVGFRATAKRLAQRLKLTGFARNHADSSVEICAQGQRAQLEEFLVQLRQEFSFGYIDSIDTDFHEIGKAYAEFRIVR